MPKFSLIKNKNGFFAYQQGNHFLIINQHNTNNFITNSDGFKYFFKFLDANEDYDCNKNEFTFLEKLKKIHFWENKNIIESQAPSVLCIGCTQNCNLSCVYCYFESCKSKITPDSLLSDEKSEKMIKFIKELYKKNNNLKIYLTGGEPFLYKDIFKLITLIKQEGIYLGIVSNATLLDQRMINKLSELGIDELRISFDSIIKKEHDKTRNKSFDQVLKNLETLDFLSIPLTISSTVTKINENSLEKLVEFTKHKNFAVNFSVMLPTGKGQKTKKLLPDYDSVYNKINDAFLKNHYTLDTYNNMQPITSCGFASKSMYLDVNGDIFPCNMLAHSNYNMGNVYKDSLQDIDNNIINTSKLYNVKNDDNCKKCSLMHICAGACRAAAYYEHDNLLAESPECKLKYNEIIETMFKTSDIIIGD